MKVSRILKNVCKTCAKREKRKESMKNVCETWIRLGTKNAEKDSVQTTLKSCSTEQPC